MPFVRQLAFKEINKFFDHVYVITIEKATERREKLVALLDGLDYEFFYGMDKAKLEADPQLLATVYNEEKSKQLHRFGHAMTIGHIACSLSHTMVYRDMIQRGYKNALIFEDDVVPMEEALSKVPEILKELPPDWGIVYWGYDRHEHWNMASRAKQVLYHFLSAIGLLKWNHTMIRNLHARPYSTHLRKAGLHDLTHAYSLTQQAAAIILNIQTPVVYNADPAVAYGIVHELVKGFIAHPMVFKQGFQVAPDEYVSMVKN